MKRSRILSIAMAAMALSISTSVMAQQQGGGRPERPSMSKEEHPRAECKRECGRNEMEYEHLKLTDEQKAKLKDLKIAHQKETLKLRNKMGELHAHLRTLSTAEVADMKAINATIDEITQTQNQMMKSREGFKQQIRAMLTEEQRLQFDMQKQGRGRMHGRMGVPEAGEMHQ